MIAYIFKVISDCICLPILKVSCFQSIYLIGKLRLKTNKKTQMLKCTSTIDTPIIPCN